ncbi:MAG TPA: hypothetical protein PK833_10305, partial [Vicingus sp.]|nr:hypothetical protein [Vicingus sp.]
MSDAIQNTFHSGNTTINDSQIDYATILNKLGGGISAAATKYDTYVDAVVKDLKATAGESIVICGSNDKNVQILVNGINNLLGNYGKTIDLVRHSNTKAGNDTELLN